MAIANGWPAELGTHDDPHHVPGQWIGSGTAISVPIAPLAALAVFAVLTAAMATPGDLASLWRIDPFEQLGFSETEASGLAESDADLGQARHLHATGCSSTLALQILL